MWVTGVTGSVEVAVASNGKLRNDRNNSEGLDLNRGSRDKGRCRDNGVVVAATKRLVRETWLPREAVGAAGGKIQPFKKAGSEQRRGRSASLVISILSH